MRWKEYIGYSNSNRLVGPCKVVRLFTAFLCKRQEGRGREGNKWNNEENKMEKKKRGREEG